MPAKVSFTTYDTDHTQIVTAIASFDSQGHVLPLYIGINGNSYKVHSAWMKPAFKGHLEFNCQIIDDGCLKPVVLSYHKTEDVWTIPTPDCIFY